MLSGLDPSETTKVTLAGVDWTLGLLPFLRFEELSDQVDDIRRSVRAHAETHRREVEGEGGKKESVIVEADLGACSTCHDLKRETQRQLRAPMREIVRWGLRGTTAPGVEWTPEKTKLAGHEYEVTPAIVPEQISRIWDGLLVIIVGDAILEANRLSAREVLGFK